MPSTRRPIPTLMNRLGLSPQRKTLTRQPMMMEVHEIIETIPDSLVMVRAAMRNHWSKSRGIPVNMMALQKTMGSYQVMMERGWQEFGMNCKMSAPEKRLVNPKKQLIWKGLHLRCLVRTKAQLVKKMTTIKAKVKSAVIQILSVIQFQNLECSSQSGSMRVEIKRPLLASTIPIIPIAMPTACLRLTITELIAQSMTNTKRVALLIMVCTIDSGRMNWETPTNSDVVDRIRERINMYLNVDPFLNVMSESLILHITQLATRLVIPRIIVVSAMLTDYQLEQIQASGQMMLLRKAKTYGKTPQLLAEPSLVPAATIKLKYFDTIRSLHFLRLAR